MILTWNQLVLNVQMVCRAEAGKYSHFCPVKALLMISENFVPSSARWKSNLLSAEFRLGSLCHLCKAHHLTQSWTTKRQESLLEFSIWRLSEACRTSRNSIGRGSSCCCSFHRDWPSTVENLHWCNSPREHGEREVQFIDPKNPEIWNK